VNRPGKLGEVPVGVLASELTFYGMPNIEGYRPPMDVAVEIEHPTHGTYRRVPIIEDAVSAGIHVARLHDPKEGRSGVKDRIGQEDRLDLAPEIEITFL
jgi:hypothetical protein